MRAIIEQETAQPISNSIRKVYVDGSKVAMAIAQRIAAKQEARQAVISGASA